MAIDADLLTGAKAAESRLIEAEHAADVARADFHRAVRILQLSGGSLREIADALGLSHQRVHQIVESAGGSRRWRKRHLSDAKLETCSFCGKDQKHVKTLIAGPGVFICNKCITRAVEVLDGGTDATTGAGMHWVSDEAPAERCSFCGKRRHQVPSMAAGGSNRICAECLNLCDEIIDERLA